MGLLLNATYVFMLDEEELGEINRPVYLGSMINTKGDSTKGINRRIAMARNNTMKKEEIWKSKIVSLRKD